MFGVQSILKATQAVRTTVPARSLTVIAGPPRNKVSKGVSIILVLTYSRKRNGSPAPIALFC